MLFHLTWEFTDTSESGCKRANDLFSKWQPGPAQFQGFYGFADGTGGVALVEAADGAELAKTLAPWTPFLRFNARVVLPVREMAQIEGEAAAWRDAN
ncbi:MAG: DUF3303 family protein [Acidobacteria bacterium]|nr:DUF3303 family protein [Acidobacteriota bacterium]